MVQRLGLYMVRIVSEQLVTGYSHKLVKMQPFNNAQKEPGDSK